MFSASDSLLKLYFFCMPMFMISSATTFLVSYQSMSFQSQVEASTAATNPEEAGRRPKLTTPGPG